MDDVTHLQTDIVVCRGCYASRKHCKEQLQRIAHARSYASNMDFQSCFNLSEMQFTAIQFRIAQLQEKRKNCIIASIELYRVFDPFMIFSLVHNCDERAELCLS